MHLGVFDITRAAGFGNHLARKMRRNTDEVVEMCADRAEKIARLTDDMHLAAQELRFEEAAKMRDRVRELEGLALARG